MSDDILPIRYSSTEEKRAVTGLIVSNEFAKAIAPILDLAYFKNKYLLHVATWCKVFYEEHGKVPFKHIQDIYESEAPNLKETERELIGDLLANLSEQYDDASSLNVDYLVQSTEEYFRKRELEIHVNNISVLKEKGALEEAEAEIARFTRVTASMDDSLYIDLGDQNTRDNLYKKLYEQQKSFFKFPGDLGDFLGNMKPGDVIGITGAKKKGKTIRYDSLVYLNNGTCKTIQYVVENKIKDVLCMDDSMHIVPGKVTDWIYSGLKDEYVLVTKSGQTIGAAITHPFFTPDGWKTLGDLHVGDMVALSKTIRTDHLLGNDSPMLMRLLAYLIADGHLRMKKLGFTKHDKEIMDDFLSCVSFFGGRYSYDKAGKAVRILDGTIHDIIKKHGLMDCLSGDKFIPDHVLKSSNDNVSIFLNTLFTCDGSIWKNPNNNNVVVEYSSKSKLLVQQIQMCLHRFGLLAKMKTKYVNSVPYYILFLSSAPSVRLFLDKIGFSFHKKEKADSLLSSVTGDKDYLDVIPHKWVKEEGQRLRDTGRGFNDETYRLAFNNGTHAPKNIFERVIGDHPILHTDIMWDYVVAIHKKHKQVPMYDLTVEDNHNFIANSFIVHNSWLLNDFFKHAIMNKIKTVKWAIEMTDTEEIERFDKLFYPTIDRASGLYKYPVFDCLQNQIGDCGERASRVLVREDSKGDLQEHPDHVVCTKCRHTEPARFVPAVYNATIHRDQADRFSIVDKMEQHRHLLHKYSRIVVRPKYTLTYDMMMYDLDRMYSKWGFVPQILLIDYVDILKVNSKFDDYRLDDAKWKLLQELASATKCMVVTPTQANKEGELATTMRSTDQGGFYGKGRHVNLMIGINQVAKEKKEGLYRVTIMDARSTRSNELDYCIVLQDLKTGQMHLDSYWPNKNWNY